MAIAGEVPEPRREHFTTAAQYRRALAAWTAGYCRQRAIFRELRRQRRACGPCEVF